MKKIYYLIDFLIVVFFKIYVFFRKSFLLLSLFVFSLILFSSLAVIFVSESKIFYDAEKVPEKKVALVLGTAKYVGGNTGMHNLFYKKRLEAANDLIDSGRAKFLILSGTNDSRYYNEPKTMKNDLMEMGVPEDKIYLDYAGFRTLDSILRARAIFSQKDIIIISQKFHLQRAIFIAEQNNIRAVGFAAKDPPFSLSLKTYIREIFSRVNVFLDIIINKDAIVYGEKVKIP